MTAVRWIEKPTPSCGRTASAFAKPAISLIWLAVVTGDPPTTVPDDTRTALTFRTVVLGGTAQDSVNWVLPALL